MGKWVRLIVVMVTCVLLDIVLHVVTSAFSTMPENPDFSILAGALGVEMTALLWALFSFSGVALVYFLVGSSIPGKGVAKGFRYGSAIALLWLFAMLEGVPLFGNPVIKEFVVGLSDAIPVFLMGIMLSLLKFGSRKDAMAVEPLAPGAKMTSLLIFAGTFLVARYVAYLTGIIKSGYQERPIGTFFWTLLMGACIGLAFVLIESDSSASRLENSAMKFGFLVFGVNWSTFLLFMPMLFSGYLVDALTRIIMDTLFVSIGYYMAFRFRMERKPKLA